MKEKIITRRSIFIISLMVLISDQLTKYIAVTHAIKNENLILIKGLFQLRLARNTGAAFSILSNSTILLTIASITVSIILCLWIYTKGSFYLYNGLCVSFILGGAIGNGIDRLRLGYVIDFIDTIAINFPIFNLADIAINIGMFFIILSTIKNKSK